MLLLLLLSSCGCCLVLFQSTARYRTDWSENEREREKERKEFRWCWWWQSNPASSLNSTVTSMSNNNSRFDLQKKSNRNCYRLLINTSSSNWTLVIIFSFFLLLSWHWLCVCRGFCRVRLIPSVLSCFALLCFAFLEPSIVVLFLPVLHTNGCFEPFFSLAVLSFCQPVSLNLLEFSFLCVLFSFLINFFASSALFSFLKMREKKSSASLQ